MNTEHGRRFAVITGGSSGIGHEFAKVCAAEGFEVLIVAEQRGGGGVAAGRRGGSYGAAGRSLNLRRQ